MKRGIVLGCALLSSFGYACGASDDGGSGGAGQAAGTSASAGSSSAGASQAGSSSAGASSAGTSNSGAGSTSAGSTSAGSTSMGGAPPSAGAGGAAQAGANSAGAGGAAPMAQPFKGLAFNAMGSSCDDLKTLGVSWYYAWSGTAPCTTAGVEFVPMIWGSWKKLDWVPTPAKAVSKGAKYLLGFNEPDHDGQASMTVAEAIGLWPDMQQSGVLIGSPAVAGQEEWLPNFMTEAANKKLRVDFIALHWYGWNPNSCNDVSALEGKIKWAEQWQRPIWITEWSCRLQSAAVTQKFFSDALVMFKKHPRVERYAWFLSRSTGEFADAALLDASGKPTALGKLYQAAPATR